MRKVSFSLTAHEARILRRVLREFLESPRAGDEMASTMVSMRELFRYINDVLASDQDDKPKKG